MVNNVNVMWVFEFMDTNNISWNIPNIQIDCEEYLRIFHGILLVSQNIVVDVSNVTIP